MKKIQYIKPATAIVVLHVKTMILTGSNETLSIGNDYTGGGIGSRRGDTVWDDEENY